MIVRPAGVMVREQRLLVMCYRYGGRDRFNLPGGNLEPGEEVTACLAREFAEELDLEVAVGRLLFCVETAAVERHVLHLVFQVSHLSGTPCLNSAQTRAVELRWLPVEAVEEAPLYPAVAPALGAWLRDGRLDAAYLGRLKQEWFS